MISWIILVFGAAALFFFMLNLPNLQAQIAIGENLTAYTTNTTHWAGWTETINLVPIAGMVLIILWSVYAWWQAKSRRL